MPEARRKSNELEACTKLLSQRLFQKDNKLRSLSVANKYPHLLKRLHHASPIRAQLTHPSSFSLRCSACTDLFASFPVYLG